MATAGAPPPREHQKTLRQRRQEQKQKQQEEEERKKREAAALKAERQLRKQRKMRGDARGSRRRRRRSGWRERAKAEQEAAEQAKARLHQEEKPGAAARRTQSWQRKDSSDCYWPTAAGCTRRVSVARCPCHPCRSPPSRGRWRGGRRCCSATTFPTYCMLDVKGGHRAAAQFCDVERPQRATWASAGAVRAYACTARASTTYVVRWQECYPHNPEHFDAVRRKPREQAGVRRGHVSGHRPEQPAADGLGIVKELIRETLSDRLLRWRRRRPRWRERPLRWQRGLQGARASRRAPRRCECALCGWESGTARAMPHGGRMAPGGFGRYRPGGREVAARSHAGGGGAHHAGGHARRPRRRSRRVRVAHRERPGRRHAARRLRWACSPACTCRRQSAGPVSAASSSRLPGGRRTNWGTARSSGEAIDWSGTTGATALSVSATSSIWASRSR